MLERLAIDRGAILYDPRRVAEPGARTFDADYWRSRGALREFAAGRGSIQLIEDGTRSWVLRCYLRGGVADQSRQHVDAQGHRPGGEVFRAEVPEGLQVLRLQRRHLQRE